MNAKSTERASLPRIDLNLFRVFDAIWRTGSLTQAGAQLHLSQPAVSNALARLREAFNDALFQRQGRRMTPTPRAQAIAEDVTQALGLLRDTIQRSQSFEPAVSQRRFTIGMRDNFELAVLPPLLQALNTQAPRMQIRSVAIERRRIARQLAEGELDFALDVPLEAATDIRSQPLLQIAFCLVTRRGHAFAKRRPNAKQWAAARHAVVSGRASGPTMEDFALQREGLSRETPVRLQSYLAACQLVATTDAVLVLPRFYAEWVRAHIPLHLSEPPLPLPKLPIQLHWHRSREADEGHRWMRNQLAAIATTGAAAEA